MGAQRWDRVAAVFETALSLPLGERPAYLDEASSGDPELRREVEALLAADQAASGVLERVVGHAARAATAADLTTVARAGERLGAYEVIREIGHGGMGVVLLAVRADDTFRKTVAIKVVRRGASDPDVLRRFVAERQILADLEHPNIARLLDGGATDEGLPFLVIEHVEGAPLGAFCDAGRLGVKARLELFLKVCDAVQYAHGALVVHRDLKPSNILVTADGTPKLLDFGIAKLLDERPDALSTRTVTRLMTLEYASPEQVRGKAITTATDVYSLGVVLYELLAGRRPFGHAGDEPDLERLICDEEPGRPSQAAQGGGVTVAQARGVTPERLRRELSGDLDTVILKALRKEPERRYRSVEQLAADIRRHLDGLPVSARRDTIGYRAQKFVRRHRVGVATAAGVAALTVFYTVRLTQERDRARLEAARSEQVAGFLRGLFQGSSPYETRGRDVSARDLVDRGAERLERELAGQPRVRATMLGVIGDVYRDLGLYDTAAAILREALALQRRLDGADAAATAAILSSLAGSLEYSGDFDSPDSMFRQALQLRRAQLGEDHESVGASLVDLAAFLRRKGVLNEADSLYRYALALERREGRQQRIAAILDGLGGVMEAKGNYAAAVPFYREAVQRVEQAPVIDSLTLSTARNNLAVALSNLGELAEAESLLRFSLDVDRRYLGEDHDHTSTVRMGLGRIYRDAGRFDEAEAQFTAALEADRRRLGADHASIATRLGFLAGISMERGRPAEAEAYYREALGIRRKAYGEEHAYVAISLNELAGALFARGDRPGSERMYRDALAMRRRVHEPGHPYIAYSLVGLAQVVAARNRAGDAEALLREALAIRAQTLPEGHYLIGQTESALGHVLVAQARYAEAESLLVAGIAAMRSTRPQGDAAIIRAEEALALLRGRSGGSGPPR
jgi:serine/threonine-protein kinase